jgi:hypothetical protein
MSSPKQSRSRGKPLQDIKNIKRASRKAFRAGDEEKKEKIREEMKRRGIEYEYKPTEKTLATMEQRGIKPPPLSGGGSPTVSDEGEKSGIRLFRYTQDNAEELRGRSVSVEREAHDLIEKHMEAFWGIRFVAREFSISDGRIDSLGLDKDNYPVIIEYKRSKKESIISQAVYYSNLLSKHKAAFKLQVIDTFDKNIAEAIKWDKIRILCIAEDFTKYDKQNTSFYNEKNIELIRYKYYSENILMLERI